MTDSLPPLHLLRTFLSAGNHLSFKRAAEELCVTPSAVSHQMKQLEAHLDILLFKRMNRSLQLTEAGQHYHQQIAEAFTQLRDATGQLSRQYNGPLIRASILPLMASELVIPALADFHMQYPDMELRIETSTNFVDFEAEDMDVAIRYGKGHWPGLASEKVCSIIGTPVCSADYADKMQLEKPEDIIHCNLIGTPLEPRAWQWWAESAGIRDFKAAHNLSLDSLMAASRAAEQGLGLAIGIFPLMTPLLTARRLITPFNVWVSVEEGYYLVWRREDERPALKHFRDWIKKLFTQLPDIRSSHQLPPGQAPMPSLSGS